MNPSDFLTILGLAMAAWAFIADKERKFILLFFSKWELLAIILSLAFIHFLMAFDWLKDNWFPGLNVFTIAEGIPASVLAYVVAISLILYPIIKVNFSFFSGSRLKNLISLYQTLIDQNDIDLLANYITKYHLNDIHGFLKRYSHIPEKDSIDIILRKKTERDNAYEEIVEQKQMKFAASVYWNIVTNEDFIRRAANAYPELFAYVIKGMESKSASNQDFVKLYLNILFENKNQKLINELKILNGAHDSIKARVEHVDLPIMEGLMVNTKTAADNYVWYPIGKGAMKSLKYDDDQLLFLQEKYDEDLENELWHQKIYIAIVYFNYMVRETIYRDSEWHMWLFYYQYFVKELINNIPAENDCADSEYCSFNHYLVKEIINNIRDWLELAADLNSEDRWIDSIRCLGKILIELTEANEQKIAFKLKAELFESVISQYFRLSEHENTEIASAIMEYMEGMFKNSENPDWNEVKCSNEYRQIMAEAWDKFDKVPYQGFEDNGSINRFENNVLRPLELIE
jgi:hypothetical protein